MKVKFEEKKTVFDIIMSIIKKKKQAIKSFIYISIKFYRTKFSVFKNYFSIII